MSLANALWIRWPSSTWSLRNPGSSHWWTSLSLDLQSHLHSSANWQKNENLSQDNFNPLGVEVALSLLTSHWLDIQFRLPGKRRRTGIPMSSCGLGHSHRPENFWEFDYCKYPGDRSLLLPLQDQLVCTAKRHRFHSRESGFQCRLGVSSATDTRASTSWDSLKGRMCYIWEITLAVPSLDCSDLALLFCDSFSKWKFSFSLTRVPQGTQPSVQGVVSSLGGTLTPFTQGGLI